MRDVLKLAMVGFAVTVGVMIAYRMSTEAMAVVVGVVFGVLASIPGSLLVLSILRKQASEPIQGSGMQSQGMRNTYPQVIVIQPGTPGNQSVPPLPAWPAHPQPMAMPASERAFTIIGDDE